MSHLDLRSPYVVDTHDLGRRPGASLRLVRTVPAPTDMGIDVIGVPAGSDLTLDLLLESVMEGVLVSGTARARAHGECVRCLDPVEQDVQARIQELFAYPGSASAAADDVLVLTGEHFNVESVLRDELVPVLPFQPVCRPDCPGLCSVCGTRLGDEPADGADHHHDDGDPRWAALASLTGATPHRSTDPSTDPSSTPDHTPRS